MLFLCTTMNTIGIYMFLFKFVSDESFYVLFVLAARIINSQGFLFNQGNRQPEPIFVTASTWAWLPDIQLEPQILGLMHFCFNTKF